MPEEVIAQQLILDFIQISHRLRQRELTTGGGGGISIVIPESENLLIKGWEIASEDVREEDIALIDRKGNSHNDVRPCLETPLHLEVIKARKGIGSVIHAHPPYATAFGNVKPKLSNAMLKNYKMLGEAVFTPFAEPGSMVLANIVAKPFRQENVFCVLMQDHGLTIVGKDVYDAYYLLDMFEGFAKSFVLTVLLKNLPAV